MSIVLLGSTSGSCTLQEQAVAGSTTLTLPTFNGTVGLLVSGTAVASTSGTSIDFTSIPAGVRRITVMFAGVSTNGSSQMQIQIGSSSFSTTGYASNASFGAATASQYAFASTGFILEPTSGLAASVIRSGAYQIMLIGSNSWTGSGNMGSGAAGVTDACAGLSPTLGGALDRIRITTVNGTDTFDAGSINILYE